MIALIIIICCILCVISILLFCKKKIKCGGSILNSKNNYITKDDPSGWQLYLSTTCGHCIEQKKELNGFKTYAEYEHGRLITNNINGKLYPIEKIDAFPFWYNTKTKKTKLGKLDLNELCKLLPKIKSINCLL